MSQTATARRVVASPYLSGNYAPVSEERTETRLEVTGELPGDLNGSYLRNGPNPVGKVNPRRHHWFLGDGMIHAVRLAEGQALGYRNRWVRSSKVLKHLGDGNAATAPKFGPNTHVISYAGRLWALVEAGFPPVELDEDLNTLGINRFSDTLKGGYTAHPKLDPVTGELHAVGYWWPKRRGAVQYSRIGTDGRVREQLDIPVPGMTMLHDMALTERYIVIFDLPVTVRLRALLRRPSFPFAWDENYGARVGLLPRGGTAADVIWVEVEPAYVFHPMNAYDDAAGNVVIDVCRYARMFARDQRGPFGDSRPTLDRWVLDPVNRRASETRLDDRAQEFPRCAPGRVGRPYRYGYTVTIGDAGFPGLLKHDLHTGNAERFSHGAAEHCGEPYFVPRAGATSEDDGYIMTLVYDDTVDRSDLVVWDAREPAAEPLARVHLPVRVPNGFHGCWAPAGCDAV
ncbi:MAG: carotenoid oxygenase family protein [Gammaproteobacteria bacterium]|jgi:carotenoid cleavage dioxygenase-like enzyme